MKLAMPLPALRPEQLDQISGLVGEYIAGQRNRFRARSEHLSAAQKSVLGPFFRPDLLESTRILVLKNERIGNPSFYPLLQGLGLAHLPDFAWMAAVTYADVIVSHESFSDGLLFHEFVHAEQYRQLGIPHFATRYVCGFWSAGDYRGIPLEINAYALSDRFTSAPDQAFSVESEVASWIRQGKF